MQPSHRAVRASKSQPVLEVASTKPGRLIKPKPYVHHYTGRRLERGRDFTLENLIARTYDLLGTQISGGPAWICTDRYYIQTKAMGSLDESNDLSKLTPQQSKLF